jgi:glycerol-3-phosphate acyltransferase PlsY
MSLASLTGATLLCASRLVFTSHPWDHEHIVVTLFCLLGTFLIFVRHHGNIRRLLLGTENRL